MKRVLLSNIIALLFAFFYGNVYGQSKVTISSQESKIHWTGKKPTGEHHGYVKLKEGHLLVENNEVRGGSFIIDMNSIVNTDISNEGGKNRLVSHLKSGDFFDVPKYPTGKFVITEISKINNGASKERKATHSITGDLTLKGLTKKIRFDASINLLNGKITANTPGFIINRTEWGVNHQSKSVFADLRDDFINDEIELSVELISQ